MIFRVKFSQQGGSFHARFGAVQTASDGGYEKGYAEGHEVGYTEGLNARSYEVWTITLTDGTIIEKEVALL